MPIEVAIKALAVWAVILLLAVLNGGLREALLVPWFGTTPGFVLSGLLLATLILTATYLVLPWLNIRGLAQLLLVGAGWLLLTLVFEFSFGLLRGMPLTEILSAYSFRHGNLWPLVLLVTAMAPWFAARLRGWL